MFGKICLRSLWLLLPLRTVREVGRWPWRRTKGGQVSWWLGSGNMPLSPYHRHYFPRSWLWTSHRMWERNSLKLLLQNSWGSRTKRGNPKWSDLTSLDPAPPGTWSQGCHGTAVPTPRAGHRPAGGWAMLELTVPTVSFLSPFHAVFIYSPVS